ncbi:hypothetical protein CVT24_009997 [Panaeolus cyanescens]|uniref:Cyanovirin-N domain-containing protein n=1 Tax=Panaeolus cyanescens TaxID=181874 RepID=A0A409VY84_9AGAR|nr:hypothetical protein CVT24_009997 [Panaeolus cyanescens]
MRFFYTALLLAPFTFTWALPGSSERAICDVDNATDRSQSIWIGKNKNVEVYTVSCPTATQKDTRDFGVLSPRQTSTPANANRKYFTGNTNCFTPSGGGPDPNECHVISDALLFESENTGKQPLIFPNNTVVMQFRSCKTFFLNQAQGPLAYCRSDWASLVDFLAFNCQATQNAHGGLCVAQDGRWFVQLTSAQVLSSPAENGFCDVNNAASRSKSSWIGKDKNVEVYTVSCPTSRQDDGQELQRLTPRQTPTNVCGAQCEPDPRMTMQFDIRGISNTNCFTPSGGGPDPNECNVIGDALRYASENTGAIFPIGLSPNNTIVMQYRTCKTFFLNQDLGPLAYCRTDWAALIDWLAFNCQATQNAHGGNCVAKDQRWFVQLSDLNSQSHLTLNS